MGGRLERHATHDAPSSRALRGEVASLLHAEVAAMNLDNFVVGAKRRLVEKYAQPAAGTTLAEDSLTDLAHEVAGLPSEQESEDEEAQLAVLCVE